jgi:hypothetical protein
MCVAFGGEQSGHRATGFVFVKRFENLSATLVGELRETF